jgi:hypothetical protein
MLWIYKLVTHGHDRRSLLGSRQFNSDLETYIARALDAGLSEREANEQGWKRACLKWGVSDTGALTITHEATEKRHRRKRELMPPNEQGEDRPP